MKALKIQYDGKKKTVARSDYAKAKLRALREFGYPSLTLDEVEKQIDAVLEGKEFGAGATVIGIMMKGEVLEQVEL